MVRFACDAGLYITKSVTMAVGYVDDLPLVVGHIGMAHYDACMRVTRRSGGGLLRFSLVRSTDHQDWLSIQKSFSRRSRI